MKGLPGRLPDQGEAEQARSGSRQRRTWPRKFGDALRGLKRGIRGQSSFAVHFFFAALVVTGAIVLRCSLVQWGLLLLCIGLVLTAELFNSAVEHLVGGLDEEARGRTWPCLDIAAGAVLLACLAAACVGAMVFLDRLGELGKLFFSE